MQNLKGEGIHLQKTTHDKCIPKEEYLHVEIKNWSNGTLKGNNCRKRVMNRLPYIICHKKTFIICDKVKNNKNNLKHIQIFHFINKYNFYWNRKKLKSFTLFTTINYFMRHIIYKIERSNFWLIKLNSLITEHIKYPLIHFKSIKSL